MGRTVCLGENDHAVAMLHSLKEMKHEQDLCDFVVKVGSDEYPTHKNILSAGSPYFKAMLKHDTAESRDGKVEMKEVDSECVKCCIDLLYSGSFEIPDGKISELLHVAIMLQLSKVKQAVSDILYDSVAAGNFYETRRIAEVYNIQTVLKKCEIYYKENIMAISSQDGFKNETKSHLINMFKSKTMNLSEKDKLTITLRWVGNIPQKMENLFELIKLLNLADVPSTYLSDLLHNHPVISNDFRLYKLLSYPMIGNVDESTKSSASVPDNKKLLVLFDMNAYCLQTYDPVTDEVTKLYNEKFEHLVNFTAISMDSYIYVLCSNKSVHRLNVRDKMSKWERMRDTIADHGPWPSVVGLSGSLFVVGSSGLDQPTKIVEIFDPVANRWLRLNDKPEPIRNGTLASLNESIFCIGGQGGRNVSNSFCKFTPSSSEWVDLEPMKNARCGCSAVVVEQKIFVMCGCVKRRIFFMGGYRDSEKLDEVECYDVTSGQWTSLSPMIEPHGFSFAHHIDGWIFQVSRFADSSEVEKYDIANDKWQKVQFKDVPQFNIYDSVLVHF